MNGARHVTKLAAVASASAIVLGLAGLPAGAAGTNAKDEAARILGEWSLSFTTKDVNRNRILDDPERKTRDSAVERNAATGFLRFEKDGTVVMDRKLRFRGRYQILAQEPRDELVLTFEKDIGTYRMLIIQINDEALVLEPGIGMFDVYRRP
jgi:hypothetical protein